MSEHRIGDHSPRTDRRDIHRSGEYPLPGEYRSELEECVRVLGQVVRAEADRSVVGDYDPVRAAARKAAFCAERLAALIAGGER